MRKKIVLQRGKEFWIKNLRRFGRIALISFAFSLLGKLTVAQDGLAGINQANQQIRSYFEAGSQLMYGVGAVLGLIGAVKVFQKWNNGEPDTAKVAAAWFGSCVFLVLVTLVLKSFFGL